MEEKNKKSKIGRNDPCHCGSGKKYKKCCLKKKEEMIYNYTDIGFAEFPAGFEKYINLFKNLSKKRDEIANKELDGLNLQKGIIDFIEFFYEKDPKNEDSLPLSYFTCWSTLDYWFGKEKLTVLERYLRSYDLNNNSIEMFDAIKGVKYSYPGFFKVEIEKNAFNLIDVYMGNKYENVIIPKFLEKDIKSENILFTRVFDDGFEAYLGMEPIIIEDVNNNLQKIYALLEYEYKNFLKSNNIKDNFVHYLEMHKFYFFERLDGLINNTDLNSNKKEMKIYNSENERFFFITIYFKIKDKEGLCKKLDSLKDVRKSEFANAWIWIKEDKFFTLEENILLGDFKIEGENFICEVNSFERAIRFLKKFDRELSKFIVYEKHEIEFVDVI